MDFQGQAGGLASPPNTRYVGAPESWFRHSEGAKLIGFCWSLGRCLPCIMAGRHAVTLKIDRMINITYKDQRHETTKEAPVPVPQ